MKLDKLFDNKKQIKAVAQVMKTTADASPDNRVDYDFIDEDGTVVRSDQFECFRTVHTHYKAAVKATNKKIVKLRYTPSHSLGGKGNDWLALCHKEGIIPKKGAEVDATSMTMDLNHKSCTDVTTYIALVTGRFIREAPTLVKNVLKLTGLDLDFYASLVVCHGLNKGGGGHSYLGYGTRPYTLSGFVVKDRSNIGLAWKIKNVCSGRATPGIQIKKALNASYNNWNAIKTLAEHERILLASPEMLLSPKLKPVLAGPQKQIIKKIKELGNDFKLDTMSSR